MGWFEEYPWLLIPIIIITVEAWNAVKAMIRRAVRAKEDESKIEA